MNTLSAVTNKQQRAAALHFRNFSIYRKVKNNVSIPHIIRTYKVTREEIAQICARAKEIEDKYKHQDEGVIRHPLDDDICHDLYLEILGEKTRPSRDENILFHPDFNGEDLTVSTKWSNKDIEHFCEQYVAHIATLLRNTNKENETRELMSNLESDFFKVCCKVAGFRPDEMVYLIKRKLKQYKS